MDIKPYYPNLEYPAHLLYKFKISVDFVTIMLRDGHIVHFHPRDVEDFKRWLIDNGINQMD